MGRLVGCLVGLRLVENGAGNGAWCNFFKTVHPRLCSMLAFFELSLESGAVFSIFQKKCTTLQFQALFLEMLLSLQCGAIFSKGRPEAFFETMLLRMIVQL